MTVIETINDKNTAAADGDGNIAEKLPDFFLDEDDGDEDRDGRERACEDRAPNFARAFIGRGHEGLTHLSMPVNVLEQRRWSCRQPCRPRKRGLRG